MLGINKVREGWCYHANQEALRDVFWSTFNEALGNTTDERIEVARLTGLFLGNGWQNDDEGNLVPAQEGSYDLAYLEAVVLGK